MTTTRRAALGAILAAPLSGIVLGHSQHHGTGPDLTFVAEEWLRDALALGMLVMRQPDGNVWRSMPVYDGPARAEARNAHFAKLEARPRLKRAVLRLAESGFVPELPPCA